MTVNDRGNIKWASLMLPEHVEWLQDFFQENHIEKPLLTDDEKEEIEYMIKNAIDTEINVRLTYFTSHSLIDIEGVITGYNSLNKTLHIHCADKEEMDIPFTEICAVQPLE